MIYSVVTMIIKPGKMEEFLAECKKLRTLVLKETGCRLYDYTVELKEAAGHNDPYDENRVTLYEQWIDQNALEIHSKMPYMSEFVKKVASLREKVSLRIGTEAF